MAKLRTFPKFMDVSKRFQRLPRRHFESCLRHKMANGNGFDVRAEVYWRRTPSSRHKRKAFLFRSAVLKKQCHCLARQGSRRWWSSNSTLKLLISMVIECGGSAASQVDSYVFVVASSFPTANVGPDLSGKPPAFAYHSQDI